MSKQTAAVAGARTSPLGQRLLIAALVAAGSVVGGLAVAVDEVPTINGKHGDIGGVTGLSWSTIANYVCGLLGILYFIIIIGSSLDAVYKRLRFGANYVPVAPPDQVIPHPYRNLHGRTE